jgi:hypothetical protein
VSYIVREKKSLPRWASGTLVVATVAGTALLLGGVANAAPLPGSLSATTTTLPVIPAFVAHAPATESLIATLNPAATNDIVCNMGNRPGDRNNLGGFCGNGGDRNNLGGFCGNGGDRNNLGGFCGNGGDRNNLGGFCGNGGDRNNLGGFCGNGGDRGGPGNRGIRGNLGSPCDSAIPGNFGSQGNSGILGGVQGILGRNLGGILGGLTKLGA